MVTVIIQTLFYVCNFVHQHGTGTRSYVSQFVTYITDSFIQLSGLPVPNFMAVRIHSEQ